MPFGKVLGSLCVRMDRFQHQKLTVRHRGGTRAQELQEADSCRATSNVNKPLGFAAAFSHHSPDDDGGLYGDGGGGLKKVGRAGRRANVSQLGT